MGEDIKREKENESSARQVKVRGRERNPHAERETKEEEIRKEIREMNLVLWGFVLNLSGSGSEKVRGKKGTQQDSVGPESQSSTSAQSVPSVSFHILGSLDASSPTSLQLPGVYLHSPISWYKDLCLASAWGGFRGAGVSIFMISSQHCFHWPAGRTLIGGGEGED